MKFKNLLIETNRGLLVDLVIFAVNLVLMNVLVDQVLELFRLAGEGDPLALFGIFLGSLGMLVLPAAGAVLKRWHFHQRLQERNRAERRSIETEDVKGSSEPRKRKEGKPFDPLEPGSNLFTGCIFSPIFYFCFALVLSSAVFMFIGNFLFGKNLQNNASIFIPMVIMSLVTCIVLTVLVYRYFYPPKKPPKSEFLRRPWSEQLGDLCILINMLLFQVFWNVVLGTPFDRVSSVSDFIARLFFLTFVALLVYFPPRIFFLAEDFNRPVTWLTMLLANSPLIFRVLIGGGRS